MMNTKQTIACLLLLQNGDQDDKDGFNSILEEMIEMLDEGDQDDMWGTEGWRFRVGLEE